MAKDHPQDTERFLARIDYLENSRRFIQGALEMVLSMGDIQESTTRSLDPRDLLADVTRRIRYLLPTEAIAIYTVDQESADFRLAYCDSEAHEPMVAAEVEHMIEQDFFAWAIRERRGILLSSRDHRRQFVAHVIATVSRIRGMLVGLLAGDGRQIPDTSLTLLSIILQNTAGALESMEFYRLLRNQNILLEEKVRERTKALAEYERQMQLLMKMQAIGTLAGGIAHDFNNILFPIVGFTELTMDDVPADSQAHRNLEEILKAANRAKELVQQILTFSRQNDQERKPLRMQHIVKESLRLLRASIPSSIEIVSRIDDNCRPILGDPTQVHQVIMNLCTNAYQAMSDTGGRLMVALEEVELSFDDMLDNIGMKLGPHAKLTVSDDGVGMEPAVLERIFEPYFTTKEPGKGTGLGLSVIHGIVKNHGGHVRVKSAPGAGTTFEVFFPLAEEKQVEQHAVEALQAAPGDEHILVVDDEPPIVRMVCEMLERLGYRVTCTTDSTEALALFSAEPQLFDLVITDMTMPRMNGDTLARKILAIRPSVPVILCTGFNEHISEAQAEELGIAKFVMKPIIKRELAAAIRTVLDVRHHGRACAVADPA